MKAKKFYVVWKGKKPGVYSTWNDCKRQIDGFKGAQYKSFNDETVAKKAFLGNYNDYKNSSGKVGTQRVISSDFAQSKGIILDSICVDAACSGNPGKMEYRGVETATGVELFKEMFDEGTSNIGEFLALVHVLALAKSKGDTRPIYSDSRNGMSWVTAKRCRTNLQRKPENQKLFSVIQRAERWLTSNEWKNKILKWNTREWGEIPADFGRK